MRALLLASLAVFGSPLTSLAQVSHPAGPVDSVRIAAAVAALPEAFRATATVLAPGEGGAPLVTLRAGDGLFICIADDPADERFHVACYHRDLEPFMQRGRELRAQGHTEDVDSIRYAEIEAGTLVMPTKPTSLYSLTGEKHVLDPETGAVVGAQPLYVVYIPHATAETTGLPVQPARNVPWLMFPGTAGAHIMYIPEVNR